MRIHVTGNAGGGKTTLAKELGSALGLDVFGLDKIVWKPNWEVTPLSERKQLEQELADQSDWIIEGVSSIIRRSSDFIVFLDFPRHVCLARCIKRTWKYLFSSRPELPKNCPEIKVIPLLVKIIWQFPKAAKPFIVQDLGEMRFVRITSNAELSDFVCKLKYGRECLLFEGNTNSRVIRKIR